MDTAQWPQEIVVKPLEEIVTNTTCPKPATTTATSGLERKARPQKEQALNCPRCNSTNTKFCYYNNYSLTQPRYFCKTCRRYWTEGGSLRNIPVGGGSRKNKRSSSSSSSKKLPDLVTPSISLSQSSSQNPNNSKIHEGQDLNLAFPSTQGPRSFSELIQVPSLINEGNDNNNNNRSPPTTSSQISALELLTGISSRGLNSLMPMQVQDPNSGVYTSGFPLQEFKPSLGFSLDGLGNGYGSLQETAGGRLLFPFEDLKQISSTGDIDQTREPADSNGYWTGMLGGGSGSW